MDRTFSVVIVFFFFQAEDGIRDFHVTGVQTCALPICLNMRFGTLRINMRKQQPLCLNQWLVITVLVCTFTCRSLKMARTCLLVMNMQAFQKWHCTSLAVLSNMRVH